MLTWRGDKLVTEAAPPSRAGRTPSVWPLGGDDSMAGVTMSVVDGVHHLTYGGRGRPDWPPHSAAITSARSDSRCGPGQS